MTPEDYIVAVNKPVSTPSPAVAPALAVHPRLRQTFVHLTPEQIATQAEGHVYMDALKSTEPIFTQTPQGIWIRPTCVESGGQDRSIDS